MSQAHTSQPTRSLDQLNRALAPLRAQLVAHPIYARLGDIDDVRLFQEQHIWAVWDFMSLLKALQRELTCIELPWIPKGGATTRRLINEIVVGEESDEGFGGVGHISHFELYLAAMTQCGSSTTAIEAFIERLRAKELVPAALARVQAPTAARRFVGETWRIVESRSLPRIAAAFTLGREDVIPDMFTRFVHDLSREHGGRLSIFIDYLERHIHLDGERHAPMAARMLEEICGDDRARWEEARIGAECAIRARIDFWSGIAAALEDKAASRSAAHA